MTKFSALALESEKALINRLASYDHALDAGAGFVENVPKLTREGWRSFVETLNLRVSFPGIRGLGLADRVDPDGVRQFLERMREDNAPDFEIHPATPKNEFFIVSYIEPVRDNGPALGLNIAFECNRRDAAILSMESGNSAITGKIMLVQDDRKTPGFLTMRPLYEGHFIPKTIEERKLKIIGWVYEPFIAKDFMQDLTKSQGELLNLRIYDGDIETDKALIYSSEADRGASTPLFSVRKTIELMQKRWTLVWTSTPFFERQEKRHDADLVLIGGTVFSALFGAVLVLIAGRKAALEERVKIRTAELEAARLTAELANKAKTQFLANMSHELRTPMHAILGYSELGAEDGIDDPLETREFFNKIHTAGNRLLILLNDLLDLSKLESGKMDYKWQCTDFKNIIDHSLKELDIILKNKEIVINIQNLASTTSVVIDCKSMTQVAINILSNAIKFSDRGRRIQVKFTDDCLQDNTPALRCCITDEGPGIPESDLEAVFDKFVQSSETKCEAGGTGLGLAICREIVGGHGGIIWAENVRPRGAAFSFVIPWSQASTEW